MKRSFFAQAIFIFLFSLAALSLAYGQAVPAPDGWSASQQGSNWVYKAGKLSPPAVVTVTVEPPGAFDKDLGAWFDGKMKADAATRGKLEQTHKIKAPNGVQLENRDYRDSSNHVWLLSYIGIQVSPQNAVFCAVAATPPESTGTYVRIGGSICGQAAKKFQTNSNCDEVIRR
jgi:hypothetical protein